MILKYSAVNADLQKSSARPHRLLIACISTAILFGSVTNLFPIAHAGDAETISASGYRTQSREA